MLDHKRLMVVSFGFAASAITVAILLSGCSSTKPATTAASTQTAAAPSFWGIGQESGKSGSELWADNCNRCHNSRSPTAYSRAQWDIIMHHMRLRASLTAEETTKITAFLRAAD